MRVKPAILSALILLLLCVSYLSVTGKHTELTVRMGKNFSIPYGSKIYRVGNRTVVYGTNGSVLLNVSDSNVSKVCTPAGACVPATHVIQVPSGSLIKREGNVTKVYKNGKCILTVLTSPH